jgi:hypothetical protein
MDPVNRLSKNRHEGRHSPAFMPVFRHHPLSSAEGAREGEREVGIAMLIRAESQFRDQSCFTNNR